MTFYELVNLNKTFMTALVNIYDEITLLYIAAHFVGHQVNGKYTAMCHARIDHVTHAASNPVPGTRYISLKFVLCTKFIHRRGSSYTNSKLRESVSKLRQFSLREGILYDASDKAELCTQSTVIIDIVR